MFYIDGIYLISLLTINYFYRDKVKDYDMDLLVISNSLKLKLLLIPL
jgi:hypothetical protein